MWISLTQGAAAVWCLLTPLVFIGSIYVKKPPDSLRDDPKEIKRRFLVIGVTTLLWPLLMLFLFSDPAKEGPSPLVWLGLSPFLNCYLGSIISLALCFCLYLGPLFQVVFEEPYFFEFDIKAVRALIAAPVYEETVFRVCLIVPMVASGCSLTLAVVVSSVIFGTSHLYHLVEAFSLKKQKRKQKIHATLVQAAYTTVFGLYVGYLFVGTGTLFAPVVAHSFCNYMGLPDLSFLTPSSESPYKYRYYIVGAYLVGILAFSLLLPRMANPSVIKPWLYSLSST